MYCNGQNAPRGLQPSQYNDGSIWNGQLTEYLIPSGYATSLFTFDPVSFANTGTIVIGTIGGPIVGVFMGVKYVDATGTAQFSQYWPANTVTQGAVPATALVCDDPNVLFDIQCANGVGGGPVAAPSLTQAEMFENANFGVQATTYNPIVGVTPAPNPGAGNTANGLSGYYLDTNSIANTATLNLKLIRFTQIPGNIAGVVFNNALVKINNHYYNGGTGTAGV